MTALKVVYVSEYLRTSEFISNKESFVVYNAVSDVDTKKMVTQGQKAESLDAFQVLMACSLRRYKGVQEFFQIARVFRRNRNSKIKFVLVLNATRAQMEEYFLDCEIPDNVELYSAQENMENFYLRANLLLNLSRVDSWIETFGLTIVEAMSYSVPVIVPPVGGPLEIVRPGIDGYLVDSRDHIEIARLIERLSLDQELWRYLARNARERSLYFGVDKFCAGINQVVFECKKSP
ncbi:hypothetical protein NBRC116493_17760 [Aurantivibrio infirmus]